MIRSHKFYSVKLQGRLVRPEGLKPSTCRVEADCSIQLSYGRIFSRASGGARTRNLLIKSQEHYQLCYGRKIVFCLRFLLFIPFNFIFFCVPDGIRTHNSHFKRVVRFQLRHRHSPYILCARRDSNPHPSD